MSDVTKKGTRIRVVKGRKHKDAVGTVFWSGPDKYNEGKTRLGVKADDGETIWVASDYVEAISGGAAAEEPPPVAPPNKGDRVRWKNRGQEGVGTVFWVGPSKSGPGHRVGIRQDDSDDAVWCDARQVTVVSDDDAPPTPRAATPAPAGGDDVVDAFADGAAPAGASHLDADVPFDDSAYFPIDEDADDVPF